MHSSSTAPPWKSCGPKTRPQRSSTLTRPFAVGETDEGLDVLQPIVVEGELVVIRHPARGQFRAVVELQVREARRVR